MPQAIRDAPAYTDFAAERERRLTELESKTRREAAQEPEADITSAAFQTYPIGSQICWIRKSILSSQNMLKKYEDRLAAFREKLAELEAEQAAPGYETQRRRLAKSGVRGVYLDARTGKWRANAGWRKKQYLGSFPTIDAAKEAIRAYKAMREEHA